MYPRIMTSGVMISVDYVGNLLRKAVSTISDSENLKGKDRLENEEADGRRILKCVSKA
jgi:hypothetical protein